MKMQEQHLARRRQELIARSTAQRAEMTKHGHSLSDSMSAMDKALGFFKRVKQHPVWIVGLLVGVIAIRPRRLAPLLQAGVVALRTLRLLGPVMQGLRMRR